MSTTQTTAAITATNAYAKAIAAKDAWEAASANVAPCPLLGTNEEAAAWMAATAAARADQAAAMDAWATATAEWNTAYAAALAEDPSYLPTR